MYNIYILVYAILTKIISISNYALFEDFMLHNCLLPQFLRGYPYRSLIFNIVQISVLSTENSFSSNGLAVLFIEYSRSVMSCVVLLACVSMLSLTVEWGAQCSPVQGATVAVDPQAEYLVGLRN